MFSAMLPPDLIYEISIFLSPSALIKLSLCSKRIRDTIKTDQRIWRTQYYKEWPAFYPTPNSSEDILFPAPTWIQTFFMRKLSELNIERRARKASSCILSCAFFQDVALHYDHRSGRLAIHQPFRKEIASYNDIEDYDADFGKIRCGETIITPYNSYAEYLHCFSANGDYIKIYNSRIDALFAIDDTRFVSTHLNVASIFTVTLNNEFRQHNLNFPQNSVIGQVYGRSGHCFVFTIDDCAGGFNWSVWDLRGSQATSIMKKKVDFEDQITKTSRNILGDTDFVFIPFRASNWVFVYVYSFKEDSSRIFKIRGAEHQVEVAIFYASSWNSMISRRLNFYNTPAVVVCFSGTKLHSLTFTSLYFDDSAIIISQVSRKLLFMTSCKLHYTFKAIDMHSGVIIWEEGIEHEPFRADINSRYLVHDIKMYDCSPEKPPEISEWFYPLFE